VINDLILDLQKQLKVTSIVVTHDMKSAYKIASRIAMLHEGRVLSQGSPDDFRTSSDERIHQFVNGLSQGPIKMKLKDYEPDAAGGA